MTVKHFRIWVRFTVIGVGIITMAVLFSTLGCGQFDPRLNPTAAETDIAKEEVSDASISSFKTVSFNANELKWTLTSKTAAVFKKKERTYLKTVHLTFYDPTRQPTSYVVAEQAVLESDTQNIALSGNVSIRNVKGTAVSGPYFYWNNSTEKLTSPKLVNLRKPNGFTISGSGFSADKELNAVVFTSTVSGNVQEQGATEKDFFDIEF